MLGRADLEQPQMTFSITHAVWSERQPPSLGSQPKEKQHMERWQLKALVNRVLS